MKNRTVIILLAAAVVAAIALTFLYRGVRILGSAQEVAPNVVVIFKTIDYKEVPFWGVVRDGVVSGAREFGVNVLIRGPMNERDIDAQLAIVRQAMDEHPAAIVLAAADYNRLVPLAEEIRRRHIPLITIDSFVNSQAPDVRIGTNSYEGGQKCGIALMRYVEPGATVAVMSYVKESSTAIDRESGARDYLQGKVHLLDTLYSESDALIAYHQAQQLIASTPDLRGIVALNDPTARGVARALDESGRANQIALVGFDNSFVVLKYVERGIIRDTVVQKPFNMGYLGIQVARELIDGRRSVRYINTGSVDISAENMFLPENQKLLFPVAEEP